MKLNNSYYFIYPCISDYRVNVISQILRRGAFVPGRGGSQVLHISSFDKYMVFQPDVELIFHEDITRKFIEEAPEAAHWLTRLKTVCSHFQNPYEYPKMLERLLGKEDLETKIWELLEHSSWPVGAPCPFFVFDPPVFSHDLVTRYDDTSKWKFQIPYMSEVGGILQSHAVEISPTWLSNWSACWCDGGYFLTEHLMKIVEPFVDPRIWQITEYS